MISPFPDRLTERMIATDSRVVVGIDPDLARIRGIPEFAACDAVAAYRGFCRGIIEATAPFACAVKPQVAFFECLGSDGWVALAEVCSAARARGLPVILDAKRGDIGSTARAYAELLSPEGPLGGVDAITVNPYLGGDSVEPFLAACDRHGTGLFILVKTSNKGASDLQDLRLADGRRLCEAVADLVAAWGGGRVGACGRSSVGAVVGATHPADVAMLRDRMPQAILLVPGVGAQGGDPALLRPAFGADGLGAIVNSSRGILYAWEDDDSAEPCDYPRCAAAAASKLRSELADVIAAG